MRSQRPEAMALSESPAPAGRERERGGLGLGSLWRNLAISQWRERPHTAATVDALRKSGSCLAATRRRLRVTAAAAGGKVRRDAASAGPAGPGGCGAALTLLEQLELEAGRPGIEHEHLQGTVTRHFDQAMQPAPAPRIGLWARSPLTPGPAHSGSWPEEAATQLCRKSRPPSPNPLAPAARTLAQSHLVADGVGHGCTEHLGRNGTEGLGAQSQQRAGRLDQSSRPELSPLDDTLPTQTSWRRLEWGGRGSPTGGGNLGKGVNSPPPLLQPCCCSVQWPRLCERGFANPCQSPPSTCDWPGGLPVRLALRAWTLAAMLAQRLRQSLPRLFAASTKG